MAKPRGAGARKKNARKSERPPASATKPGPRHGGHAEVTAESLLRRASAHRKRAKDARRLVQGTVSERYLAVAIVHEETGDILEAEASEIRSHP